MINDDIITKFVEVCVKICRHYGFHGWLLNIENKVESDLIPKLLKLVQTMSAAIKQEFGEDGVVLWYDSVTTKVKLK